MRRPLPSLRSALVALCVASGLALPTPVASQGVLVTEYDDLRSGREGAAQVEAEMGLVGDPELQTYVRRIGKRLLRGMPRRPFEFHFAIVDQSAPNAFALPGGYIYVSRGLLALANNEDELANVIGHEITHAARRHAAAKQRRARYSSGLLSPWRRAAAIAAYGRDMERDADRGGQQLAAAAGYDPRGMSTFLRRMGNMERMRLGYTRMPGFLDTHPGSRERATTNAVRAREIRWQRDPELGNTTKRFFEAIDGLALGQQPSAGVFVGDRFLHAPLDFHVRFPPSWNKQNTNRVVGAMAPQGGAVVYLTAGQNAEDAEAAAWAFSQELGEQGAAIRKSSSVQIGAIPSWRLEVEADTGRSAVNAFFTFIPYAGGMFQMVGVAPAREFGAVRGRLLSTARSFRPLNDQERRSVVATRLRVVTAQEGESLEALGKRTRNAMPPLPTATLNGLFTDHVFEGGESVKIAVVSPYVPSDPPEPPSPPGDTAEAPAPPSDGGSP